ncbi:MAG: response regulator [Dehalococcoidales bacterium]|nr:response regulator [Dehalococcoidales bacterium]
MEVTTNGKEATILIVDDEAAVRKLLKRALSSRGYTCRESGNAAEALNQLKDDSVGLVLLDVKMPGKTGVELLPEIRGKHPDTVVIMATGIADTEIAVECMKRGAYDFIAKPFNIDEVVVSVRRALEKRRLELANRFYQQHLEQRVAEQAEKIRASFLNTIASLACALEAKDRYTSGHSQRVAQISEEIAREMGLPEATIEKIRFAGQLHDIGKIGVRETVLNKPGRLTDEEFEHMGTHPEIGEHILAPALDDAEILGIVRHHHERYDGNGYPDRLAREEIPLGARVLAVADAFDAMTSERPYRETPGPEIAVAEIERGAGSQFDPKVVAAFMAVRGSFGPALEEHSSLVAACV